MLFRSTQDDTALAAMRSSLRNPEDHRILPEVLSKGPVGAVTRQNDSEWNNVLTWVFAALVNAEEKDVTQANVDEAARSSADPDIQRMLGKTGTLGPDAGLPADWALNERVGPCSNPWSTGKITNFPVPASRPCIKMRDKLRRTPMFL